MLIKKRDLHILDVTQNKGNKMRKARVLLVLLIGVWTSAQAGGWLGPETIDKLALHTISDNVTSGVFLYADGWQNPNSCNRSDAVVLLETDPNYDKAYALILTAYSLGKTVSAYSDGCVTFDSQTYNKIRGFKYLVVE